jgi:hypothetical protein
VNRLTSQQCAIRAQALLEAIEEKSLAGGGDAAAFTVTATMAVTYSGLAQAAAIEEEGAREAQRWGLSQP